jgi:hypothetical protein
MQLTSGVTTWTLVGVAVGLLWAVLVGFSLHVPGAVHGMLLLQAKKPGLPTLIRHLEVYWPVTLILRNCPEVRQSTEWHESPAGGKPRMPCPVALGGIGSDVIDAGQV